MIFRAHREREKEEQWDRRFMAIVKEISAWSKDRSTKVGAVIVGPNYEIRSTGVNGFPRGVNDDAEYRHERPMKYKWTEHAERNAIYNAARVGVSVAGCRVYVSWCPCMDCARAIVQTGILEVICPEIDWDDEATKRWAEDFNETTKLFQEAGVSIRWIKR